jgi:polysaccharide export outer membrane protein
MISMKFVGNIRGAGLTTEELERSIERSLQELELLNAPHVNVSVREYASQPVSIIGAVRMPNIYQIKGQKTLFSMIALAQGIDVTTAGKTIQVIRAQKDGESEREVITIDVSDFQEGNAALDIPIYANDTINVRRAGVVFAIGEVVRPGEYTLKTETNTSVLRVLSKSGGATKEAKKQAALLVRIHDDGKREDFPLDLDRIIEGKAPDVRMLEDDILFVPPNKVKTVLNETLRNTIGVVSGRLIYRP